MALDRSEWARLRTRAVDDARYLDNGTVRHTRHGTATTDVEDHRRGLAATDRRHDGECHALVAAARDVGLVALLVGGFLIFNTFTGTVAQRTKEYALLRVLGASRGQVLRSGRGSPSTAQPTSTRNPRSQPRWLSPT